MSELKQNYYGSLCTVLKCTKFYMKKHHRMSWTFIFPMLKKDKRF